MNEELKALLGKIISSQTAYKNAKLIGHLLVVTLNDGSTLTKHNATEEDYKNVVSSKSLAKVKEIMLTSEEKEKDDDWNEEYNTTERIAKTHKEIEDIVKKRIHKK